MNGPDIDQLRADAEKYRWLVLHFPAQIVALAWSVPDARADACNVSDDPQQRVRAVMEVAVKQAPGKR